MALATSLFRLFARGLFAKSAFLFVGAVLYPEFPVPLYRGRLAVAPFGLLVAVSAAGLAVDSDLAAGSGPAQRLAVAAVGLAVDSDLAANFVVADSAAVAGSDPAADWGLAAVAVC